MRGLFAALVVIGIGAFGATAARAEPLPDGGVTPAEVTAVFQAAGLPAEASGDEKSGPTLKSNLGGIEFYVHFYDCTNGRCASIGFSAGFDLKDGSTPEAMNKWNRGYRFARAFLDDDKDPYLQMDRDFEHGGTTEAILNELEVWGAVLEAFTKYLQPAS